MKPKLKRKYYYRVRKGDSYLSLTGQNCSFFGTIQSASETISLAHAKIWAENYGGTVEKVNLTGDQQ